MIALSSRIRKARTLATLSQAELARRVAVKRSAVTQWESPAGTTPSVEHLIQIALETGVQFEWLATGRGPRRLAEEPAPAVMVEDYALDELESRVLVALRRVSRRKREAVTKLIEVLSS